MTTTGLVQISIVIDLDQASALVNEIIVGSLFDINNLGVNGSSLVDKLINIGLILLRMLRIDVTLERQLRMKLEVIAENTSELRLGMMMSNVNFESGLRRIAAMTDGTPIRLHVIMGANVGF